MSDVYDLSQLDEDAPDVAVIGLGGCYPQAPDIEAFWEILRTGREVVRRFSDVELRRAGIGEARIADPAFVPARASLEGVELFDAEFFQMSPGEAELTDPQHRLFLEACWSALEDAAHTAAGFDGSVGVFAGCSANTYLTENLLSDGERIDSLGGMQALVGNDKDYLATRVSYLLDLRGPSLTVQTACSTSLVAIHLAWQALTTWQCDMALAGGASVHVPGVGGHTHRPGGILSPDGHTRTFDAAAAGAVGGDGVGVVVLRRLADALRDGDPIRAILKGGALNNDGAGRQGFTAPSIDGQARVIAAAHAVAGVSPEDIDYVEAHGTATPLGDPIEVAALRRAFGAAPAGRCGLGSVKSQVGHLNAAAGVAAFTKTVLSLQHGLLPASLHFETPNPRLELEGSPFFVVDQPAPWSARLDGAPGPRRAGVSSFGVGGTNAHLILEEAPARLPRAEAPDAPASPLVLALSARSAAAVDEAAERLRTWLQAHPEAELRDVAFTLATARRPFAWRRAVVATTAADALSSLSDPGSPDSALGSVPSERPAPVAFLFPGQGFQRVDMGRSLYEGEPVFRAAVDRVAELCQPLLGADLRQTLYPAPELAEAAAARMEDQIWAGPVLFAVSYASAMLWLDRGVVPSALLGQSTGEYMAAAVAGVMSLEDALRLFIERSRLMDTLPRGSVLHVALPPEELEPRLLEGTWLALVNGPRACVVTGRPEAIDALSAALTGEDIPNKPVRVSVPAHSPLLAPIAPALGEVARSVTLSPPRYPVVSGTTGQRLTDAEATDPDYWVRHLLQPVQLAQALSTLGAEEDLVLIEAGPARSVSALATYNLPGHAVVPSLPGPEEEATPAGGLVARGLAALWAAGVPVSAASLVPAEDARRISLPTYPFQRRRYWIDAVPRSRPRSGRRAALLDDAPERSASRARVVELEPRSRRHPRPDLRTPHVAPRNDAERLLVEILRDLLGIEGIGVDDDFFSLGGSSLITLELIQHVKKRLGAELPPAAAFQGLTVARMARYLDEASVTEASGVRAVGGLADGAPGGQGLGEGLGPNLVPLRAHGEHAPLFFVHPAAGIVFPYFELARRLGDDHPFYGVQAEGLDGTTAPDHRVEEMAARYLPQIRALQPEGPYWLGGYSFGCYIAYELALRLQAAGEEVAFLGLVDEGAPVDGHRPTLSEISRLWLGRAGRSFLSHLHDYLYLRTRQQGGAPEAAEPAGRAMSLLRGRPQGLRRSGWRSFVERSAMAALLPEDVHATALGQPAMRPLFDSLLIDLKETFRYAPRGPYEGDAVLFKSDWSVERPWWERSDPDPTLGWGGLISGEVKQRRITGDHLAVLRDPHVGRLAQAFAAALAEAREARSGNEGESARARQEVRGG